MLNPPPTFFFFFFLTLNRYDIRLLVQSVLAEEQDVKRQSVLTHRSQKLDTESVKPDWSDFVTCTFGRKKTTADRSSLVTDT